jgi:hypothetical protein
MAGVSREARLHIADKKAGRAGGCGRPFLVFVALPLKALDAMGLLKATAERVASDTGHWRRGLRGPYR